jgi:flagellar biosynthesis protein FliQ
MNNSDKYIELLLNVLLKDLELMRAEIRMYIEKQYLVVLISIGVLTYGIFNSNSSARNFSFLFIPFIVSGTMGFLAFLTHWINKTAGYVRLLEKRIEQLFKDSQGDRGISGRPSAALPPIFWETVYSDFAYNRDKGTQMRSLHGRLALRPMSIGIFVVLIIVVSFGITEALKWSILGMPQYMSAILYVLASIAAISYSYIMLNQATTMTRKMTIVANEELEKLMKETPNGDS